MTARPGARAAALVAALPLAGGVLLAAAPAASAQVNQPVDGAVYERGYNDVAISADFGRSTGGTERLFLTSPGGPEVEVDSAPGAFGGGSLSYTLRLECWTPGCTGTRLAPNGTWTIRQAGSTNDTGTFVTRNRPRAPEGVTATAVGTREVRVSWRLGEEPDLTGFRVLEGGAVVKDGIGRGACEGGTCSTVIGYATDGSGEHTYAVQALRSTAPGSSSTLESPPSGTASARLDAPAAAEEPPSSGTGEGGTTGGEPGTSSGSEGSGSTSAGTTSGGGSGGGTGGSAGSSGSTTSGGGTTSGSGSGGTSGGSAPRAGAPLAAGTSGGTATEQAVAQRKAFALGFSAFGPKLGIPKLPPLPQSQTPAIAPELPDGTFEPTLGFEDQVLTERVPVAAGPTERVRNVVGGALDSERLVRSTAAALVLLLLGAHLRRWLGSSAEEH